MSAGNEERGNGSRDSRGRFAQGNPGGPGNPHAKQSAALRRAAIEAIGPEHVQAMIRKAARMGLEGNLGAMRFVLDRVCGRAAEAPKEAEPVPVTLPRLHTAADCNVAIERLIDGIVQGTVDREAAKLLIDAIETRLKAIEVNELEERLAELERAAESVERGPSRSRRF